MGNLKVSLCGSSDIESDHKVVLSVVHLQPPLPFSSYFLVPNYVGNAISVFNMRKCYKIRPASKVWTLLLYF